MADGDDEPNRRDWRLQGRIYWARLAGAARQVPYRSRLTAALVGVVVGTLFGGVVGLLLAVTAGFAVRRRTTGFDLPLRSIRLVKARTLPAVGRVLVGMIFFLPIATFQSMPSGHTPDTLVKYASIVAARPSNLFAMRAYDPFPGAPILVLGAMGLMFWGMLHPRRRRRYAALAAGIALYLAAGTITQVVTDNFDFMLPLSRLRIGFYAAILGMVLLAFPHQERLKQAAVAPLLLLPFAVQPQLAFGLSFEVLHHGAASVLSGLAAGALAAATIEDEGQQEDGGRVYLELRHPAGHSPKVFTEGWLFGARCILNPGGDDQRDVSDQVNWSGTGAFGPAKGATSRPAFAAEGANTITLSYDHDGVEITKTYTVTAVRPDGYAHVGSNAVCPTDSHGCPACPHPTKGSVNSGSATVQVDGLPAARAGDTGDHATCCGPNWFMIAEGDASVLIDGRPAARMGSKTNHCGGEGTLVP